MASAEAVPAAAARNPVAREEAPKKAPKKAKRAAAAVGSKKPRAKASSSSLSHPPYIQMISEAIASLKERTGSSHYAIAKFIEEKQPSLPPNFKKLLYVQIKRLVAGGKLVKVKNSFKIPASSSKPKPAAAAAATKKKPAVGKPKGANKASKPKAAPVKAKTATKPKPKAGERAAKVARTSKVTSPGKKAVAAAKAKKAPMKVVKKPKSIKSPAKKAQAKKARKI